MILYMYHIYFLNQTCYLKSGYQTHSWAPWRPANNLARRGQSIHAFRAAFRRSFEGGMPHVAIHSRTKTFLASLRDPIEGRCCSTAAGSSAGVSTFSGIFGSRGTPLLTRFWCHFWLFSRCFVSFPPYLVLQIPQQQ